MKYGIQKRRVSTITVLRVLLYILLVFDLSFIFFNSAQDGKSSGNASHGLTELVVPPFVSGYEELETAEKELLITTAEGIIRECAHFLEFVPLGFSVFGLWVSFRQTARFAGGSSARFIAAAAGASVVSGALYAASDELHQLLSDGRAFQVADILTDTAGVFFGIVCCFLLLLIIKPFRRHLFTKAVRRYTVALILP